MNRNHRLSVEVRAAIKLAARQRVEAVWTCVGVLSPDLTLEARKALAQKVLELCSADRKPPRIQITPAQITSIIWSNMRCINPHCPMLLFSNEIAAELNEFFKEEE